MPLFSHHKSIRDKFSLVIISACFAVLLLVTLLFGAIEYSAIRQNTALELETLSAVLGYNLRDSLMNTKKPEAEQVLSVLETNPHIHAAYLFNQNFKTIAHYLDANSILLVQENIVEDFSGQFPPQWRLAEKSSLQFGLNYLSIYTPIYYQNTLIGGLYIFSDLVGLEQKLYGLLLIVLAAGGIAVWFAWVLSARLQKPISGPILALADTMSKVSESGSYHLRTQKQANDEVGLLVDGFNDMLSQIEARDQKIETHQKYLEQTVIARTAELTKTVSALELARTQADTANQAKSVFLANMTHELRTPLVGVLGMNELLMESSLAEKQRALAESVQRSGQELLLLINDILDFSKIEGGHLRLEICRVDLLGLVQETVMLLSSRAYTKGLEFISYVEPAAAWVVEADGQRLKQILVNLLGNAIKFTQFGHVGISLTRDVDEHFVFEVYDTGIGVDSQNQSLIFDAFTQVDESTARLFGGTGLGLSIVRDLTRMMSGTVQLKSEPNRGSSFKVNLPLKAIESSYVRLPDEYLGRSALLFEPYSPARQWLAQLLTDVGFATVVVASVEELELLLHDTEKTGKRLDCVFFPDGHIENGKKLFALAGRCCNKVIGLRNSLREYTYASTVLEISKPLLWGQLLRDDLFKIQQEKPATEISSKRDSDSSGSVYEEGIKGKVLVVDDNASTRELIGFSLTGSGWLIDNACNANEALAALASESYHLILMDINLPGMDGLEATRIMRRKGLQSPVYALSAHGDVKLFDQCLSAGMQGVLRKPFRQKELFSLLQENINLRNEHKSRSGEGA